MGDDQRRPPGRQRRHGLLDQVFAVGIEGAGGFIQQQDRGVGQQRAGDRQALLLAPGQADALVAQRGVVTVRQCLDKLLGVGDTGDPLDLVQAGLGTGIADVVCHRAMEQRRALGHEREAAAQGFETDRSGVGTIDADLSGVWLVEAQKQVEQGGFAGPGWPHQGQGFPGLDGQREILERWRLRPAGIVKGDPIDFDPAADRSWQLALIGGAGGHQCRLGLQ